MDLLLGDGEEVCAALFSPENRYYGKCSPFESLMIENLRFLSSKQALFDLAVSQQYYQIEVSWFAFGGSYAQCMVQIEVSSPAEILQV
ncbi:hypothetical protein EJB05_34717, partial [Eragrostis curvula]